jgi:hypothetical protein
MINYPAELPHGFYHRRVVATVDPGRVRAGMEDESHCMNVTVLHDGTHITDITSDSSRTPWSSCPNAGTKLRDLIGLSLRRMHETTGHDAKLQCTHLFDLTRLAIARAKVGASVQYDVAIEDRVAGRTRGELLRNGMRVMEWQVDDFTISGPEPFTGHRLKGAPQWPAGLDHDTLEASLVMRRVFWVAQVREPKAAAARAPGAPQILSADFLKTHGILGRCFSYQLQTGAGAASVNSWRDFAARREALLEQFTGTRSLAEMQDGRD